jgi:membrane-associated HD superfamily phosphohydrolase
MSDEIKTVEDVTPGSVNKVELEQEKLDALINKGYAKGAEKAQSQLLAELGVESLDSVKEVLKAKAEAEEAQKTELEKLHEQLEAAKLEAENAKKEREQTLESLQIQSLANESGVNDIEYFKFMRDQAKASEGFNDAEFLESLKQTKPFLFNNNQMAKPKIDSSSNKGELEISQRIKGAKTMADLDKLFDEIGK